MMYIYNGKLNFGQLAENECITILFPAGIEVGAPISAFWQWTKDVNNEANRQETAIGIVHSVNKGSDGEHAVTWSFAPLSFTATASSDFKILSATVDGPNGGSGNLQLNLHKTTPVAESSIIYTGTFNWFKYAVGEMATLVLPEGVAEGAPFLLYSQWTRNVAGVPKANRPVDAVISKVTTDKDGDIFASVKDVYYSYDLTFKPSSPKECTLTMTNPKGDQDPTHKENVLKIPFSDKVPEAPAWGL